MKRFGAVAITVTGLLAVLASVGHAGQGSGGGAGGTGAAGAVQVSIGTPATRVCGYASLVPGDLTGSATCSMPVTYTGAMSAYLSLTITVQSKAGRGGARLYDGTGVTGLTISASDGTSGYTVPTGTGAAGGSCPSGFTCWTTANDLAGWYGNGRPDVTFTKGDSVTFTVTPRFPRTAGNPYQGGAATLTLTVQAVQAPSNPLPAGCGIATIGRPCPATAAFSWS